MGILPSLTSKKVLRHLKKKGFFIHHQTGSHIVLKNNDIPPKRVTLPLHNKDLKLKTLLSVLHQVE